MTLTRPRASVAPSGDRLDRIAKAVLFALVAAFLVTVLSGSGSNTAAGRVGGDYPAFYGAGRIVLDGDAAHLYDVDRQKQAENDLFAGNHDGLLYFAYPPVVAALYAPLAELPYRLSYVVHTLLMVGALVLALWLVRPMAPIIGRRFWIAVLAAVVFFPMFRAIGGGQNTALTVLLLAVVWRSLYDDHEVSAGVAIGLLLFKPQLAVLFLVLMVLTKRWRALGSAAVVGGVLWLVSAALQGPGWMSVYWSHAQWFTAVDARINGRNAVSFLGAAQSAFGEHATWALGLAWVLSAIVVALTLRTWWRADHHDLAGPMAVACACAVLAVPHVMFYDAGLLVLTAVAVLAAGDTRVRMVLIALGAAGVAHVLAGVTPANPLVLVSFAAFVVALATVNARTVARPPRAPDDASAPSLSIVVPAYNEAARIDATLDEIAGFVARRRAEGESVEVIVVDDGSTDGTSAVAQRHDSQIPTLRVVRHTDNRGKGAAVRTGMLAATGRWRLFTDADGSTPIDEVVRLVDAVVVEDADIAVGSIAVEGASVSTRQPAGRVALGMLGSLFIRLTVVPGIRDTQRGFKLFSGPAADHLFARATTDRWGFDVEVLAMARRAGYRITEVGVQWAHREGGGLGMRAYLDTLVEVGKMSVTA